MRNKIYLLLLLLLPLGTGCLITTGSFNHGKMLSPGERMSTYAIGGMKAATPMVDWVYNDSLNDYNYQKDSTRYYWTVFSYNYRVGLLRKYPFGRGLETGFHLEFGYRIKKDEFNSGVVFYNIPILEVDTRFGLRDIILKNCLFHHNISTGWIVGYWIDNGWFLGYNAGWEFKSFIPYTGARIFLTATNQLDKDPTEKDYFTKHERNFGLRFTTGTSIALPYDFPLIPEYISPEVALAFPRFSTAQQVGISWSLGVRWKVGW